MVTHSEIYERACAKKSSKCCPDCESSGCLYFADEEVLVCSSCGYSIDAEDLFSAWFDKIASDYDYCY